MNISFVVKNKTEVFGFGGNIQVKLCCHKFFICQLAAGYSLYASAIKIPAIIGSRAEKIFFIERKKGGSEDPPLIPLIGLKA
jgi:hypothetical protein